MTSDPMVPGVDDHSSARQILRGTLLDGFAWVWIATAILFAVSAVVAPGTLRPSALYSMLPFAAILAIVAVGQTIVIQQRGLDMSAGTLMTLGGGVATLVAIQTGSTLIGVLAALSVAAAAGVLNGLLVARLNIIPIIATLATNSVFLGLSLSLTGGNAAVVPQSLARFSAGRIAGIPYTVLLALVFILLVAAITKKTVVGRRFVSIGANPAAALAAGIPLLRYQLGTYAGAAICFAVAGVLYAGYIGTASPIAGNDYLLPSIAAVVVGGTPFTGGRGSVLASGVAAVFMTQLGQMVLALGAGTAIQLLVQAGAIVAAVAIRNLGGMTRFVRC